MQNKNQIFYIFFLTIWSLMAFGQRLPDKQESAVYAPANVKIDGKNTEWGEPLMAFNRQVWLYYTIANDNDNLYLIVQATNKVITSKILQGGVTFTLNAFRRSEKGGITITYPLIGKTDASDLLNENAGYLAKQIVNSNEKGTTQGRRDSTQNELGKRSLNKFRLIGITGVKEFPEGMISMYNTEGIKAGANFSQKNVYYYELCVPLKYFGLSVDGLKKFNYNIKLLGSSKNNMIPPIIMNGSNLPPPLGDEGIDLRTQNGVTDFWGEYRLVKK